MLYEGSESETMFESLIIASDYEPYSILERLVPYLSGSASIVIHSPSIEVRLPYILQVTDHRELLHEFRNQVQAK